MRLTADDFHRSERDVERRRKRVAWLATFTAPLLIVAVAFLLLQQVLSTNRLENAEAMSQDRRALILTVLSAHQDIETASRGYIITGREEFLEPYTSGDAALAATLPRLKASYADDPSQLRRLGMVERLSRAKRHFAGETIALRREGNVVAAGQRVASGEGKRLMDALRAQLTTMLRAEISHLEATSRKATTANETLRYLTFGLLAVLAGLLIAAAAALWRMLAERNRALIAFQDTASRRAAILQSAMDGIVILNPSGTIESVNAAATDMFGYPEADVLGRDAGLFFAEAPPIGWVAEMLRDMELQPGRSGSLQEIIGRRQDGSTFPADVAITVAPLNEGLRYVAVVRDITERKRVEQMKTEFVSTVSHELRTPLSSIAGSLGLLTGGAAGELGERAARLITIAHNNADRLVRLINDILDIEKLESGKMRFDNQRIDLVAALQQAVEESRGFAETYGVKVAFDPDGGEAFVYADPDRLAQVITNLLSNAIKFSPSGGTVKVALAPGKLRHRITVADQGPGIPEEFRSRIFGKFAQADASDSRAKGGTGLGLSIVREIVSRLDGTVGFESRDGEGTQFNVQLPALGPDHEEGPIESRCEVLLCARYPDPRFGELLTNPRYRTRIADGLVPAAALLDSTCFDVILVDMGLPEEAAVEVIRRARRSLYNENTPTIAIGEPGREGDAVTDLPLVVDWLHKPAELESIGERIDAAIVSASGARPAVLHVDDDPDILRVVAAALRDRARVTSVKSLAEARAAIAAETFDLAILDLTLRDGRGPELLGALRGENGPIPIVVFSAEDANSANLDQFDAFLTKARTPMHRLVEIVEREARKAGERAQ